MGHRGRERMVRCEKCGREVRRDKAVFIEKPVLTNPLERKDVYSETYTRVLTREVSYCISCGKHGRIFEKKKKQLARQKEREKFGRFSDNRGPMYPRKREYGYSQPNKPASETQVQTQEPAGTAQKQTAEEKPSDETAGTQ
ncbi:MAG TPA: hypothetical protein VI875_04205 [Candidatus Norongarragalinales archaeon]|nr:hypothetical protein [Candidatus Norongarragalinales archaeon]